MLLIFLLWGVVFICLSISSLSWVIEICMILAELFSSKWLGIFISFILCPACQPLLVVPVIAISIVNITECSHANKECYGTDVCRRYTRYIPIITCYQISPLMRSCWVFFLKAFPFFTSGLAIIQLSNYLMLLFREHSLCL